MSAAATQPTIDYGHVELLPVHFDDLDPMGMVHNSRYALLIERALATSGDTTATPFAAVGPRPRTHSTSSRSSASVTAPLSAGQATSAFTSGSSTWEGPVGCIPSQAQASRAGAGPGCSRRACGALGADPSAGWPPPPDHLA
jgi:hypothetical protein